MGDVYVNAIRKIYDPQLPAGTDVKDASAKCLEAGYHSFLWNGDVLTVHRSDESNTHITSTGIHIDDLKVN